jgi:hypothetical protein
MLHSQSFLRQPTTTTKKQGSVKRPKERILFFFVLSKMKVDLNEIQTLADNAAKEETPALDFPIPSGCEDYKKIMKVKESKKGGLGFFAMKDIEAGSLLLASKPLALIMGWEEDDGEEEEEDEDVMNDDDDEGTETIVKGSKRNGMLVIKLLKAMKSDASIWFDKVDKLYPREVTEDLPLWLCESSEIDEAIDQCADELKSDSTSFSDDLVDEIRQRLPLIVKYNCLSIETGPELFVHPSQAQGGHISLSATGLYFEPSFFNHSSRPNVSRYCIGDVMFFVANQGIQKDEELCISYIEGDLLMESSEIRSRLLDMDFDEETSVHEETIDPKKNKLESKKEFPIIDVDTQDDLMSLDPLERLHEINDLLKEVTKGTLIHEGENGEKKEVSFFKCDEHQLRILLALTYESLGSPTKAIEEWKKCIQFVDTNFPPHDENGISLKVQAALCSFFLDDLIAAKLLAKNALESHNLLFGGGVQFFLKRYSNEFNLHLRPQSASTAINFLWPKE